MFIIFTHTYFRWAEEQTRREGHVKNGCRLLVDMSVCNGIMVTEHAYNNYMQWYYRLTVTATCNLVESREVSNFVLM